MNRRWIWIGAGAALVVLVAAVVITVLATRDSQTDGPGDQFERAAKAFHQQYDTLAPKVADELGKASGGFSDPSFTAAQLDARKLGEAFDAYGKAIAAVAFPEQAKAAAGDLVKATQAGGIVWTNAAGFFAKDQMQATLDKYQKQVESALAEREQTLRSALAK